MWAAGHLSTSQKKDLTARRKNRAGKRVAMFIWKEDMLREKMVCLGEDVPQPRARRILKFQEKWDNGGVNGAKEFLLWTNVSFLLNILPEGFT